jgi:hypothetical protein
MPTDKTAPTPTATPTLTHLDDPENVLDLDAVDAEIIAGAKAFTALLTHAADDWTRWSITIRGLRALRNLAFAQAHTSDILSHAYRKQIGELLKKKKYAPLANVDKQTRSVAYKLMDNIEEISTWYAALPAADQMKWKHPEAVAKHCPKHLLPQKGHNKPEPRVPTIKRFNPEIERLKALLLQVLKRLIKYEPGAAQLLDQISPSIEPDKPDSKAKPDGVGGVRFT